MFYVAQWNKLRSKRIERSDAIDVTLAYTILWLRSNFDVPTIPELDGQNHKHVFVCAFLLFATTQRT